jgi:hypothetical protein
LNGSRLLATFLGVRTILALAASLLPATVTAASFYEGNWDVPGGPCVEFTGVKFTPYATMLSEQLECRITDVDIDGTQATMAAVCADAEEVRYTVSLFLESPDPNTLRITNADDFQSPTTLVRCDPE